MNLVEAGNVPRSLFVRFFGPKHATAHEVRVLLLQSIERTARIRKRQSRFGARRIVKERTVSPWNRDLPPEEYLLENNIKTPGDEAAELEASPLDPKIIAKHARDVAIRDVRSRRGVRTPGDLLTILGQVEREAQAVKEGRQTWKGDQNGWNRSNSSVASRLQTATMSTNGRKNFGMVRHNPPPPPELCAEFERLMSLEERKMEAEKKRKVEKVKAEQRRKLGEELDEDLDPTKVDNEIVKDLDLEKVTGDPVIRRKASLILSEAHMLRVIERRKTIHLQL
ncbi:hypothetical protein HDU97_003051 [Phlyctochytrium planicorne]|nr:hypothetical protein HDU97_003051 [Phlyctochytrium planicorne]